MVIIINALLNADSLITDVVLRLSACRIVSGLLI